MNTERAKRKLSAILSADVKGYSRLMGEDEVGTVRILKEYRELMSKLIKEYRGRVVDSPGDNVLAEFASVVDALECSIDIQKELKTKNAALADNRKMEFRIGVNLGDVIEDEDRVYGDGVNIAARIEGLAEPGGICISGSGFEQVRNKLPLGYKYLGEHTVKNIVQPIKVYRVLLEPEQAGKIIGEKGPKRTQWRWAAAVALLVLVAGGLVWNSHWRAPKIEPASKEKMAYPLPDKPSIAVLPFTNMTGDPSQEFLPDGITENIITALSGVPQLFVIARNSTFTYKGKAIKVQHVAEELGVRYVLEGSVARSGNRIRVTAQLIDALNGHHLWAERYDRELKDLFDLQDDLTAKILVGMQLKLTSGEQVLNPRAPKSLETYMKIMQGTDYLRHFNIDSNNRARLIAEEIITIEPDYFGGHLLLGSVHMMDYWLGSTRNPALSLNMAIENVEKSAALTDRKGKAFEVLGYLYAMRKDYDKAIKVGEQAIAMIPNGADAHAWLASSLNYAGRPEDALPLFEKAMRLNPIPPAFYYLNFGHAYRSLGLFKEAVTMYKKTIALTPNNIFAYSSLAGIYGLMGKEEEAKAAAAEVLRINPKWSIEYFAKTIPMRDAALLERFIEGWRKAGLPDKPPLPLPDKPSIAVLPFVNMSDDKSQEYFSDGLTEEIITALSKTPKLFVIARNSSFVYKDKPVNVQQVSRDLGVKYVLEGSVRRSGDQLRITAQLIDATTGNHLWAERYNREMKDIFAIHDEVTMKILTSLQVTLTEGEHAKFFAKGTKSLEAYLVTMEASVLLRGLNRDDNALAIKKCEEAIALDPQYARPLAILSVALTNNLYFRVDPVESLRKAYENAQKAVTLDDMQLAAYAALEWVYSWKRQYEEAIAAGEKTVKVAPGSADAYFTLGRALNIACRDKEAVEYFEKAIRLNPFPPTPYYMHLGFSNLHLRNYEQAVTALKKALSLSPKNQPARGALIVTYVEMGRMEEATAETEELLKIDPKWTSKGFEKTSPLKDPQMTQRRVEAWRKVGLEREVSTN